MENGNSARWRQNRQSKQDDEEDDLLVFGYSSTIFPCDDRSDYVAEERHLVSWNGDGSVRLDRSGDLRIFSQTSLGMMSMFDCRLMLSSVEELGQGRSQTDEAICPTEAMEEEMCEEERYKDMYMDIQNQALITAAAKQEEERKKRAEVAFDYGTNSVSSPKIKEEEPDDSDSEDEPFEPPPGIKLPMGLEVPESQKQNHIIERTAVFVVAKGPQMEIVIKAKQRNKSDQFGFLEFDNILYPYYKYISKLIREKKYTPNLNRVKNEKQKPARSKSGTPQPTGPDSKDGVKSTNALAAIAEQHGSDSDSDSDCELHPSLMAASSRREASPDILERTEGTHGPKQRPPSPEQAPISHYRTDYDMSKSNDTYASLFKNLAQVSQEKDELKKKEQEKSEIRKNLAATAPPPPDEEYRKWWFSFYGTPCPYSSPRPMVPPPPDLEPIVVSYAEFVAVHGAAAEAGLMARPDLQLNFMHPTSPHYSYYQHKLRCAMWVNAQRQAAEESVEPPIVASTENDSAKSDVGAEGQTGEGVPSPALSAGAAPSDGLNRKARRRLNESIRMQNAPPPGVVDPVNGLSSVQEIVKAQSSPALLGIPAVPSISSPPTVLPIGLQRQMDELSSQRVGPSAKPYVPTAPVSFTLAPGKEETKMVTSSSMVRLHDLDEYEEDGTNAALIASAAEQPSTSGWDQRSIGSPVPVPPPPQPPHSPSMMVLLQPPAPPSIPNNTQLDRREKARVFMEKLLNEKRVKKLKETEEALEAERAQKIKDLEKQKLEIERQIAESEAAKLAEEQKKAMKNQKPGTTLDMIDQLINSRISNILQSSGLHTLEPKPVAKAEKSSDEEDEARRRRKKEKKKKHKHRSDKRERSRSRSRSGERAKKRRRSRSRSKERTRNR